MLQMLDNQIAWYFIHCIAVVSLFLVTICGDFLFQHAEIALNAAFFDNLTHGAVGGLSWLLVCLIHKGRDFSQIQLLEVLLCSAIASGIDLDHFYAARSLNLKDVHRLQSRPPLHSSTFPLITSALLLCIAYIEKIEWLSKFVFILLTAFVSHHVRDGTRRGLWFYPFGSTKPIPYAWYIWLTVTLPYYISFVMYVLNSCDEDKLRPNDVLIKVFVM